MLDDYMNKVTLVDCEKALKSLPKDSIDAIITDPPYGLSKQPNMKDVLTKWINNQDYSHNGNGFMGNKWDSFVPKPSIWKECLRILKPEGILAVFSSSRTQDLSLLSIQIAIQNYKKMSKQDVFHVGDFFYIYGSGFPKSLNIQKALLKKELLQIAETWKGYGTALKPAYEPVNIFRKNSKNPPKYPDNVNFFYTSKTSKKEKNLGCQNLKWFNNTLIQSDEYDELLNKGKKPLYGNIHPTVKPITIMKKLIQLAEPCQTILDPFAGSGSTLVAATSLGKNSLGFELEQTSTIIANQRLKHITENSSK